MVDLEEALDAEDLLRAHDTCAKIHKIITLHNAQYLEHQDQFCFLRGPALYCRGLMMEWETVRLQTRPRAAAQPGRTTGLDQIRDTESDTESDSGEWGGWGARRGTNGRRVGSDHDGDEEDDSAEDAGSLMPREHIQYGRGLRLEETSV